MLQGPHPTLIQTRSLVKSLKQATFPFHPDQSVGWRQKNDPEGKYLKVTDEILKAITGRKKDMEDFVQMLKQQ